MSPKGGKPVSDIELWGKDLHVKSFCRTVLHRTQSEALSGKEQIPKIMNTFVLHTFSHPTQVPSTFSAPDLPAQVVLCSFLPHLGFGKSSHFELPKTLYLLFFKDRL